MPVHQRLAQVKHIWFGCMQVVENEQDRFDQEPKLEQ